MQGRTTTPTARHLLILVSDRLHLAVVGDLRAQQCVNVRCLCVLDGAVCVLVCGRALKCQTRAATHSINPFGRSALQVLVCLPPPPAPPPPPRLQRRHSCNKISHHGATTALRAQDLFAVFTVMQVWAVSPSLQVPRASTQLGRFSGLELARSSRQQDAGRTFLLLLLQLRHRPTQCLASQM
jgi:hypothetical protein